MKKFTIKYEDHSGECHCEDVTAYSEQHALTKLSHDCKEVYWIKPSQP